MATDDICLLMRADVALNDPPARSSGLWSVVLAQRKASWYLEHIGEFFLNHREKDGF